VALRQVHLAHPRRPERHGDVDEDAPGQVLAERAQRIAVRRVGDAEEHRLGLAHRPLVAPAADGVAGLRQLLRADARLRLVARPDRDPDARLGQTDRDAAPGRTGPTEDSYVHAPTFA